MPHYPLSSPRINLPGLDGYFRMAAVELHEDPDQVSPRVKEGHFFGEIQTAIEQLLYQDPDAYPEVRDRMRDLVAAGKVQARALELAVEDVLIRLGIE